MCHDSRRVFQILSEEDVKNAGIAFTYDAPGHPELGKISKSHIIDNLVEKNEGTGSQCQNPACGSRL